MSPPWIIAFRNGEVVGVVILRTIEPFAATATLKGSLTEAEYLYYSNDKAMRARLKIYIGHLRETEVELAKREGREPRQILDIDLIRDNPFLKRLEAA